MSPYKFFTLFIFALMTNVAIAQVIYPDNHPPGDIPQLFAKNIMSDGLNNRDFTISPTGDEIFFTLQQPKFLSSTILRMVKKDGKWLKPEVAPFSGSTGIWKPAFRPMERLSISHPTGRLTVKPPKRISIYGRWAAMPKVGAAPCT